MRRVATIGVVFVLAARLVQAQTSTDDGIAAYVRGDYRRAAEILKPIAESTFVQDHVAQFFMGTMYENGLGVEADRTRACALYVRASWDATGPLGLQAQLLVQAVQESLDGKTFQDCVTLANIGFDHGFQSATFDLGRGNWIIVDLDGATVVYDGAEKKTPLGLATGGVVFLPIEHTELTTGGASSVRRDFIEVLKWVPGPKAFTWTLLWQVFEVVRADLVAVTTQELKTASGEHPPDTGADARGFVRLALNDRGGAEWFVVRGPHQGSGWIESDAERRERTEKERARNAADAGVDWTRVRDVRRAPALAYSDSDGCAHVFVYGWSADRTEAITIRADKDLLGLSTSPRTFDIATQRAGLEVLVHVFERAVRPSPFCTDIGMDPGQETWRAIAGTVTIELSPPGVSTSMPFAYRATVHIAGAEFVNAAGVRVKQAQPIALTALVGWVSG